MTDIQVSPARHIAAAEKELAETMRLVRESDSAPQVADAQARIRVAREWAKVQGIAEQIHTQLLELEVECLRKIAHLDAIDEVLPASLRRPARWLHEQDEDEVKELLREFGSCTSALSVYRSHLQRTRWDKNLSVGRSIARGECGARQTEDCDPAESGLRMYQYHYGTKAALVAVLESLSGRDEAFTISSLADQLIEDCALDDQDDGVRAGIREVCRQAVRRTPTLDINGTRAPRFVTCEDMTGVEGWVRVPFENARVSQLGQMVDLRASQLAEDTAALDRLRRLYDALREAEAEDDEPLGRIVARMAPKIASPPAA